ncbi:uncharacterized protein LOC129111634 isoform X2 [Anoplopoma fimbria]|uniref:uncharacterized protein LOC129111634 isoform X2 n=1 Tax=Anoplopoma fimbria TaxID=229290 RepID=UPI0023EC4A0B|nr:uncharacterized protein LOC129111634 isoform X2 [Anoplopoma fimbria]
MADSWPFSSSPPPPIAHHSSLSQSSPFSSSPPPLSSSPSPRNHLQITSANLSPQTQLSSLHYQHLMTSPHLLPHPQVTSRHHVPYPKVTSPNLAHHPQVTSPNLLPHTQVTSPHLGSYPQVTSPNHVPHPQVTSPNFVPHIQVTSPHLGSNCQVTSPYLLPHNQVSSPHLVPHAQVTSPNLEPHNQHHIYNQNHDPGNPDWSRAEPPSEPSYLPRSYGYTYQNQTTAHLNLQNQNQFSTAGTQHQDELENTHRLPYNNHTHLSSGVYGPGDQSGPVQGTWSPTPPQLQWPPPGPGTGGVAQGRWSSVEFDSSTTEDFSSTQFFHDSYNDDYAPQPFGSPTTPGPSPHYPQTPTFSSPGSQMPPRTERPDFDEQSFRQLSRDETLSCSLHEYDSYLMTSDPGQLHPHQTAGHLLQSQSELIQDQTGLMDTTEGCFSPQGRGQDVSSAAQSPGLSAGLSWREESGGGGGRGGRGGGGGGGGGGSRGGRRRGGGDAQKIKRPQPGNSPQVLPSRLLCTVCKRDFRSLPALNGHMRSHSGSRSATWLNKSEEPSPVVQPAVSMVMPVSVPIQSRGTAKACRGGRGRCRRTSPPTGGDVHLYCSLMHQEEEEEEGEDGEAGDGEAAGDDGARYTPPPMLCPLRAGPGLYCSLATRRRQRVETVRLHNDHNGLTGLGAMATASPPTRTLIKKPRINEGRSFQAEIPPLRVCKLADSDSHNALLLWSPWDELEGPASQQRVEALLTMVRSSVVPGGGASLEFALDVLSECRGDFLLTVEKLLSTPETSDNNRTAQRHPIVSWSAAERRLLVKSLQLHHKDFIRIQKAVQTKSVSECVEFYYLWKRKLSLSPRTSTGLTVSLPDTKGQRSSKCQDAS